MSTRITAALTASVLVGGASIWGFTAQSSAGDNGCKVLHSQTQTRDITGVVISVNPTRYGNGTQERTATTSRCKGETVVTYTAWR